MRGAWRSQAPLPISTQILTYPPAHLPVDCHPPVLIHPVARLRVRGRDADHPSTLTGAKDYAPGGGLVEDGAWLAVRCTLGRLGGARRDGAHAGAEVHDHCPVRV